MRSVAASPSPTSPSKGPLVAERVPESKGTRERLRALVADLVASWSEAGPPASVKSAEGLRRHAAEIIRRAKVDDAFVGWTMVGILSEFWRNKIASVAAGRRLLLLPDCPHVLEKTTSLTSPRVCGPGCGIGTIWSAAHDSGWVIESTRQAIQAIGGLVTGQYQGVLGVARLGDLEKAFGMLPAFLLPVAAVPYRELPDARCSGSCAATLEASGIDVDWVLGLVGVAGGSPAPVSDYLPLLREASELFQADSLRSLGQRNGLGDGFGRAFEDGCVTERPDPLEVTARIASDFLGRGGKFLRPFVTLAAFDAVQSDLNGNDKGQRLHEPVSRDNVRTAAVAIEVFHKSSLVHDDIEDDDHVRYGRPTVHVEQGIPAAVNIGDFLLGAGYRLIAGLDSSNGLHRDLLAILSDAHLRLAQGQGAELWWRDATNKQLTPEESLAIYGLKTSPAFEAAVAMGIRLAGIVPSEAADVSRYALHVGTGFQVLNDLKDWQGDLENDRRVAGDLLGGRPTVMWAIARQQLSAQDRELLERIGCEAVAASSTLSKHSQAIQLARQLYEKANLFARTADIVAQQRNSATAAINGCRYPRLREVLEFLLDLAVPEQAIEDLRGNRSNSN